MAHDADRGAAGATRAGFVALVGRPNVGKSTLLNALVGQKLSIVTPRAQTTREAVTGILTTDEAQIIFVDTPGLLEPRYALQHSMLDAARRALLDADLVLLLLDGTQPADLPVGEALEDLRKRRGRLLAVVNKADAPDSQPAIAADWCRSELGVEAHHVSALEGTGLEELMGRMVAALPASPFLYPADDIAVQPVRFFVAELVRETIFEQYADEVPYASVVRVEEFREEADPVYIRATIYVDRESQKGIIIGKGGVALRTLGTAAREKIEAFLEQRIYLDLWVKSMPGWRRKSASLQHLGYAAPRDDGHGN
ncbi:MAG: GTPase Era [Gemmatimonadota bacterium]